MSPLVSLLLALVGGGVMTVGLVGFLLQKSWLVSLIMATAGTTLLLIYGDPGLLGELLNV